MLVAEEEHDGAGVVQLVHLVEVRHLRDVHQVDDAEVLHLVLNRNVSIRSGAVLRSRSFFGLGLAMGFWIPPALDSTLRSDVFVNSLKSSIVDPDPHGSGTFAWIQIRDYSSGSGSS